MALPLYLAMTAAEMEENTLFPPHLAYMACHFSPYGTGLSNIPKKLPPGSMLILNDRTPIHRHDSDWICEQLSDCIEALHCSSLLLDFQRQDCEETSTLAEKLIGSLSCPVGLSEGYAKAFSCPVLLPPPPLDVALDKYLLPWQGREIWLEAALEGLQITLTADGSKTVPIPYPTFSDGFMDETLHCHYHTQTGADFAEFTLYRTREDLDALLSEAESLGVTTAIGLWQELNG